MFCCHRGGYLDNDKHAISSLHLLPLFVYLLYSPLSFSRHQISRPFPQLTNIDGRVQNKNEMKSVTKNHEINEGNRRGILRNSKKNRVSKKSLHLYNICMAY